MIVLSVAIEYEGGWLRKEHVLDWVRMIRKRISGSEIALFTNIEGLDVEQTLPVDWFFEAYPDARNLQLPTMIHSPLRPLGDVIYTGISEIVLRDPRESLPLGKLPAWSVSHIQPKLNNAIVWLPNGFSSSTIWSYWHEHAKENIADQVVTRKALREHAVPHDVFDPWHSAMYPHESGALTHPNYPAKGVRHRATVMAFPTKHPWLVLQENGVFSDLIREAYS